MTSKYSIELLPAARRSLKKLKRSDQKKASELIDSLADNARPPGSKRLKGPLKDYYRVRAGDLRVIYGIWDEQLIMLIVKIGDRKDVYE